MELLLWQLTHFSTQLVTTITLVGILIQLVGLALCLWFYFTRKPPKTLSAPYPGVTLVTTPQYDTRANTFGSATKALGNNADIATLLMYYAVIAPVKNAAWGHSLGLWKKEFQSFGPGAWDIIYNFLADDLAFPYVYKK